MAVHGHGNGRRAKHDTILWAKFRKARFRLSTKSEVEARRFAARGKRTEMSALYTLACLLSNFWQASLGDLIRD
jgi:hypothetical protein